MATLQLSKEAKSVLQDSTIEGFLLKLPPQQLERKLYLEVNKALEILGGKWNKKLKGHLFTIDPQKELDRLLEEDKTEYTDLKKELQFFETPEWLAKHMIELAEVEDTDFVLEPSIGRGGIAKFLPNKDNVIGYEIHEPFVQELRSQGFGVIYCDFLREIAIGNPESSYDVVVMNPPFTKGQDVGHVMHAWEFLRPGGRLVALTSKSWTFNSQSKYIKFRDFVGRYSVHQEDVPAGTFKEAGTNIETVLIVLEKK